jgi:hypothetical protein
MDSHQSASIIEYGISIAIAAVVFASQQKIAAQFPKFKKESTLRIIGIGVIIMFLVGTINFANSFIGYKRTQLAETVRIINAKLPREIPNGLLYERASLEPPDVIVAHFNTRFSAGGYDAAAFNAGLQEAKKAILTSPEIRKQVVDGIVVKCRYYDSDHNQIGEFSVAPDDFQSSPEK